MKALITGSSGQLGAYLLQELQRAGDCDVAAWCGSPGPPICGWPRQVVDLNRPDEVADAFRAVRPDWIVHAAAHSRIDFCHEHPEAARQVNTLATGQLAELAHEHGARLVYVSTDLVFDGQQGRYGESDEARPLSIYGCSKRAGEEAVLAYSEQTVARVSLLFGPSRNGRPSFFEQQCAALREGRSVTLFADEWRTPLSLQTAASALIAIARSDVTGLVHLGGPERMSRYEMGARLATVLDLDPGVIRRANQSDMQFAEPRPRDVSLDSSRWRALFPDHPWPTWEAAIREML